jgi:hypothetical protein
MPAPASGAARSTEAVCGIVDEEFGCAQRILLGARGA